MKFYLNQLRCRATHDQLHFTASDQKSGRKHHIQLHRIEAKGHQCVVAQGTKYAHIGTCRRV